MPTPKTVIVLSCTAALLAACGSPLRSSNKLILEPDEASTGSAASSRAPATAAPVGMPPGGYGSVRTNVAAIAPTAIVAPVTMPAGMPAPQADREQYQPIQRQGIISAATQPLSTFSIDVDTGSYANVRRLLNAGTLPRRDAVRVEELVNYFPYDYGTPQGDQAITIHTDVGPSPWNKHNLLMRIGMQATDPAQLTLPPANIVLLVDVSGSMGGSDRLPLIQNGLKLLVPKLRAQDKLAIVTYAGKESIALPATSGSDKSAIVQAIEQLHAEGSTNGHAGIQMAYEVAQQNFIKGGINRILLATDGDFNVGIRNFEQLKDLIKEKRLSGVSLSTLGVGSANFNEALMEQLADVGDGSYAYLDNLMEAQKVLNNQFVSTLSTVAKDVKVQVEFNPEQVKEYRLIGYENRALASEDFKNDKVDAGDVGAGHRVTALYEITLQGQPGSLPNLRYQAKDKSRGTSTADQARSEELAMVSVRYKPAGQSQSKQLRTPITLRQIQTKLAPETQFAAAVAAFGQRLGDGGKYLGDFDFQQIKALAHAGKGADPFGYRGEFLQLLGLAHALSATRER